MGLIERARELRRQIEENATILPDETAAAVPELFPAWYEGMNCVADSRVRYNGVLYKCLQTHDAQADWTPDAAPSLWARVLIEDPNVIPEWQQPDSTNAYMIGDTVTYHGKVYISLIDNNVWSPDAYPAGWQEK